MKLESRSLDILATIFMSCLRLLGHVRPLKPRAFAHVCGNLNSLMAAIEHGKVVSVRDGPKKV